MGTVDIADRQVVIRSHIITYGNLANPEITEAMRDEVETLWNEPRALISIKHIPCKVVFRITGEFRPDLQPLDVYQNLDPRNNYFRIEEFAYGNISFVDGIGCNSGYFIISNLYKGSTTAAHEYGHSLGLDHPRQLDIRGKGIPGIMYPRGTWVDPHFQYEADKMPGTKGGTLHPIHRRVRQADIEELGIQKIRFRDNQGILGAFTNVWHDAQLASTIS